MKNTFTLILCLSALFAAKAQNPGYFNRKNVVEFSVNAQMPVIANVFDQLNNRSFKVVKGNYLVDKKDRFDFGFRFAYMHTFKRNFGAGLEFGYDYFSIRRDDRYVDFGWGGGYPIAYEKMDVSSMMVMPKLEFSNKGSVLPMGIAHQVGLGFRFVKPVDKQYHYALAEDYNQMAGQIEPIPDSYAGDAIKGITLMYAVNVRTPLTKRLFFNYGLRYTLNFMSKASYYELEMIDETNPTISEAELRNAIRERKQWSLIQANIGLSFAF